MANWTFPWSEPVDLNVALASGTVTITAEQTDTVSVRLRAARAGSPAEQWAEQVSVAFADGRLEISEPHRAGIRWSVRDQSLDLDVTVPAGSRCQVRTASASLTCHGEPGSLDAATASGSVTAAAVRGPATVTTVSGAVSLLDVTGDATVSTASGGIQVGQAGGDVTARTVSGTVAVGTARASVAAKTASGAVRIASVARGHADATTVSGDVEVKVVPGTGVFLDISALSGRVTSELDPAGEAQGPTDLRVTCRTVSGSVRVARAVPAAA